MSSVNFSSIVTSLFLFKTIIFPFEYHTDERKALLEQIKYLSNNDILIDDRGYFSNNIVKTLSIKLSDISKSMS